jgi:hypothetical protein
MLIRWHNGERKVWSVVHVPCLCASILGTLFAAIDRISMRANSIDDTRARIKLLRSNFPLGSRVRARDFPVTRLRGNLNDAALREDGQVAQNDLLRAVNRCPGFNAA